MKHLVLFDIDHTLWHFHGKSQSGARKGIASIAASYSGLTESACEHILAICVESAEGFSFKNYLAALQNAWFTGGSESLLNDLDSLFEQDFHLYNDAKVCLESLRWQQGITCWVVSQGNTEFQMRKVHKLALNFDETYLRIVPYNVSKAHAIREFVEQWEFSHIWFIDDKVSVVEDVRNALWTYVRVIRIDRIEIPGTLPVDTVRSLEDFADMILSHAW